MTTNRANVCTLYCINLVTDMKEYAQIKSKYQGVGKGIKQKLPEEKSYRKFFINNDSYDSKSKRNQIPSPEAFQSTEMGGETPPLTNKQTKQTCPKIFVPINKILYKVKNPPIKEIYP